MAYHNRTGREFYPLGDAGLDIDTRRDQEATPTAIDGLYFRDRLFPDLADDVQVCLEGIRPFSELSLDADQVGNEFGWKEPQATLAAARRFCEKAREEHHELDDAVEEWWESKGATHAIEELGDYKWCVTAIASNAGVVVNDAVMSRLYEYAVGTKEIQNGEFSRPVWYDTAAQLAIKRDPIVIGDIDELIEAGFVPRFSPAMNLYEPEQISTTSMLFDFQAYASVLRGLCEQLYGSQELGYHQGAIPRGPAEDIGKIVAETYLRVAAMAHHFGSTFAEVVEVNARKVSQRVATNSVDKTDPNRVDSADS